MSRKPRVVWRPNPGPQTRFLASPARRGLYGGAASGGKSAALIACPLRWIHNPRYRGLYLRREATYLGDAIDKTRALYPALGARLVTSPRVVWTFPSGATLWMNHCEHESDIANYDSFEFSEVLFDELTHFAEKQFDGICARLRGTDPSLPYWSRAATNPGGVGHEWVFRRWGAWLDPQHPNPAAPGELRWYVGREDGSPGDPNALSYTFVPAKIEDNPHVARTYRAELMGLDPVRRAQLLDGDWEAAYGEGKLFHRDWWVYLDAAPAVRRRWRAWDFGATTDGDATVGVLLGDRGPGTVPRWVVLDVVTLRAPPHEVRALVRATAERDGRDCGISVPQDPGQAGVEQAQSYARDLAGFTVRTRRPTGDKTVRAGPFSAQAGARNVAVLRAAWTPAYVAELHAFPDGTHDDAVDASADAFAELSSSIALPDTSTKPRPHLRTRF
jgi:predicted phage terminase large subunit-like protein